MGKKLKEELRQQIHELVLKGYNDYQISEKLRISRSTAYQIMQKVKRSFEYANRKDIIETFDVEYALTRASFDSRKARLEDLRSEAITNEEPLLNIIALERLIHQVDLDRYLLLGDSEVVLSIRRMKDERKETNRPSQAITTRA